MANFKIGLAQGYDSIKIMLWPMPSSVVQKKASHFALRVLLYQATLWQNNRSPPVGGGVDPKQEESKNVNMWVSFISNNKLTIRVYIYASHLYKHICMCIHIFTYMRLYIYRRMLRSCKFQFF